MMNNFQASHLNFHQSQFKVRLRFIIYVVLEIVLWNYSLVMDFHISTGASTVILANVKANLLQFFEFKSV